MFHPNFKIVFNKQTHDSTDGINIRTSDDLVNNNDSNSIDDSDYDSDLSTNSKDTDDEQNDDGKEIDHILSISGLTSFDLLSHKRS